MRLVNALKQEYDVETDWDGELYCGITLKWNYKENIWTPKCQDTQ